MESILPKLKLSKYNYGDMNLMSQLKEKIRINN